MARPPSDLSPQHFFEEWLPSEFAATFAPGKRRAPGDLRVGVELVGDGGGRWELVVAGGQLRVTPSLPSGADEPPMVVRQSVEDWRAITFDEAGVLAPPNGSPLDLLLLDERARQVLQMVRGAVRFEVTGFQARTWALEVKLGGGGWPAAPTATISIDAETQAKIIARTMQPPEAFFAGKVKLSGDTGLAMQLGMALLPRFSG